MRLWTTAGGVVVREMERKQEPFRKKGLRPKIWAVRQSTGGAHGWLLLHNLKPFGLESA